MEQLNRSIETFSFLPSTDKKKKEKNLLLEPKSTNTALRLLQANRPLIEIKFKRSPFCALLIFSYFPFAMKKNIPPSFLNENDEEKTIELDCFS